MTKTKIPPDITFCVVAGNREAALRSCLQSLYDTADPVSIEVIVVDMSEGKGCEEVVSRDFPQAVLFDLNGRESLPKARNRAMRLATGRYVALWDYDVIACLESLHRLVGFMDDNPGVGIAGPKVLDVEGLAEPSARRWHTLLTFLYGNIFLGSLFPGPFQREKHLMRDWDHGSTRKVDWLVGSCWLIRREVIEEVGLLDEGFTCCYDEVEYCRRAARAGWHVFYAHDAHVVHHNTHRYGFSPLPMACGEEKVAADGLRCALRYLWKKWFGGKCG